MTPSDSQSNSFKKIKKTFLRNLIFVGILTLIIGEYYLIKKYSCSECSCNSQDAQTAQSVDEASDTAEQNPQDETNVQDEPSEEVLVIFHNATGPMSIEALEFLDTIEIKVEQHQTTDEDFQESLNASKADFTSSEGVSDSFGYYPIIFIEDRAFSGFNDEIKQEILDIINN